jgi:hypothetical protein
VEVNLRIAGIVLFLVFCPVVKQATAQTGEIHGQILDPGGALVPSADLTLLHGKDISHAKSDHDGHFQFQRLAPGSYSLSVQAPGFSLLSAPDVRVLAGQTKELRLTLSIAVQHQEVTVSDQTSGVSINPDQNANALVLRGEDLDALSDDPDELQSQLQALAGPSAGPNGGQIYIDGFTGGQLPPKSSIREIRINQNPFSAEFDRIGYGRIEILTKPGSDKFHGQFSPYGTSSALNTSNPLVQQQPSYYLYALQGNVTGPLTKNASYFFAGMRLDKQNQNIVDAINPQNPGTSIAEAIPNPSSLLILNPRLDVQLGKSNTLTVRDSYYRNVQAGSGVGALNLPEQAYSVHNGENTLQLGDTVVANAHMLNETHFQWRRIRNNQVANYFTPTVTVQGAFTNGGSNSGVVRDNQDLFELQNYSTLTAGNHIMRFGTRLRTYRDANYSTSGSNGFYTFNSITAYQTQVPNQYAAAVISNPLARLLLFDGALFFQDDWHWKPNFIVGYGLRYEGQNRIHDRADWAPRIALAWSPNQAAKAPAKTVIRAGYGWFYNRFTTPNSFSSATGTPYLIEAIHDNQINQKSYVINNPGFYDPTSPASPGTVSSAAASVPSYHTIDPHFHAALDMQAGFGVDRQITKSISGNVTYLYTRGVHQNLSNNVTAPDFDPSTYTVTAPSPTIYNYQFQSGGVYKQHQLIVSGSARLRHFVLTGSYTLNEAKSDTQGITSFVSVARNPGLDYGRASFGIRHRLVLLNTYTAPYGIVFASLLSVQSGTPYNITIGDDLTENNQFNARPTYGVCGAASVVSTPYGCLDTDPVGKGERIVPYGIGTGPANAIYSLRVSKVFGIGPRIKTAAAARAMQSDNSVSGRGLSSGPAQLHLDATAPRRYNLTFVAGAANLLNIVNLGPPNGVLNSPLFGKSQSLAGGQFASPTPGNRSVILQANFSF